MRIKEQETRLTLQEHDDDDDDVFIRAFACRLILGIKLKSQAGVALSIVGIFFFTRAGVFNKKRNSGVPDGTVNCTVYTVSQILWRTLKSED